MGVADAVEDSGNMAVAAVEPLAKLAIVPGERG